METRKRQVLVPSQVSQPLPHRVGPSPCAWAPQASERWERLHASIKHREKAGHLKREKNDTLGPISSVLLLGRPSYLY